VKKIATIHEKDVFPDKIESDDIQYSDRNTGKAIIINNGNMIALIGNKQNDYMLLPGGGIDENEDLQTGVVRECLEEVGYTVSIADEVGVIDDYRPRDKKHCISYCYIAKVTGGDGIPKYTKDESEVGMYIKWVDPKEALDIFKRQKADLDKGKVIFYNTGFNILRDLMFLEEAIVLNKMYE